MLEWHGSTTTGYGFYPVKSSSVYDENYFEKYVGYADTDLGQKLNAARNKLVDKYYKKQLLVDIGIGCGQFVESRGDFAYGYDVNPVGIRWLKNKFRYYNPYSYPVPIMTFWDSLEHIEHPEILLLNCQNTAFISMPIFTDQAHVLRSKHYRTDEHFWYFTLSGFIHYMTKCGFQLLEHNTMETDLGREDIQTFVFERTK
jgi:hypothetical protein